MEPNFRPLPVYFMTEEELDRTCVERCLEGDLEAFGMLIERYQRPVFNAVLHMVGDREDARELCQQVFMKCFEHLGSYDPSRKFFSWIYRMAMNEAINHLKSRRNTQPLSSLMIYPLPNPEERFQAAEQDHHVRQAVMQLEPKYRSVIVLRHFLHLSYHDAAEILELPERTVKSRLFTARQLLRDILEERKHAAI